MGTEEETVAESEQSQPTRIDSLLTRIKINTGEQPAVLGSQSYNDLATQELDTAFDAIKENPAIKEVVVEATVSGNGADVIVDGFLQSDLRRLDFDILGKVNDPSQYRLSNYQDSCAARVDEFNEAEDRRATQILTLFQATASRKRGRDGKPANQLPSIPDHVIQEHLIPAIRRRKSADFGL